jgi:hypothetical protein
VHVYFPGADEGTDRRRKKRRRTRKKRRRTRFEKTNGGEEERASEGKESHESQAQKEEDHLRNGGAEDVIRTGVQLAEKREGGRQEARQRKKYRQSL